MAPPSESQTGKCLVGVDLDCGPAVGILLPSAGPVFCPRGSPGEPGTAHERLATLCRFLI